MTEFKNLMSYAGKRVVVTGAGSGMGEATAKLVQTLGAEVVAIDIRKPKLDFFDYKEVDLRDPQAIDTVVAEIAGAGPVDNLFYCAGLPPEKFPDLDVMQVNFLGLRRMSIAFSRHIKRGGAISNVSSSASLQYLANMGHVMEFIALADDYDAARVWLKKVVAEQPDWYEPYSFSKQCGVVWTMQASADITMPTGVRVNITSPGPTDTNMMPDFVAQKGQDFFDEFPKPIGRNSTADEQAWPLAFLGSDAASYISGENIFTDGGTSGGFMTGKIDPSSMIPSKEGRLEIIAASKIINADLLAD